MSTDAEKPRECEQCRWFELETLNGFGYCHWTPKPGADVPFWALQQSYRPEIFSPDGKNCETFAAKESDDAD